MDVLPAGAGPGADRAELTAAARAAFAAERPRPLAAAWWPAVPGESYLAAFDALGLHDRIPVTVRGGEAAQVDDTRYEGGEAVHRVFVTPEYAGWRLVHAESPIGRCAWWPSTVAEALSAACGRAQLFYQDPFADSVFWLAAERGAVVRSYWRDGEPEWEGEPMPWEEVLTVADFADEAEYEDAYPEPNASEARDVPAAARGLSVDPSLLGPDTPVRGHGWLAVTRAGAGHLGFASLVVL
ncbi:MULTISPECIES: hypothetical protein [Kitasatospora]|uniref:Uncharacterized protein n=1 Tax=Kitasatospora setae (strain ATCC 33774 / DSM 43861 / JCM 3304 / KCC A-0304 / NBRC 14216 / KM-6054) TaxID=452652 RepID=E4N4J4_KITSK|nr:MULTISPECIES: hypothetical protein [Kitasatospora]BAJ26125.1 hypothetical protein KSE_02780 [Kitasatospora setae KM-6054]